MKKSILFINGNLRVGGVEMALVNLLNCIDSSKYDVDLLLLQDGYDYELDLPEYVNCIKINLDEAQGPFVKSIIKNIKNRNWDCVNYRIINLLAQKISLKLFRLLSLSSLLKSRYDAVIAFRPGICADIALYKAVSDLKICWWHHGDTNIGTSLKTVDKQLSQFNKIVAVSNGVKEMLSEAFPNIKSKISVVPNIVDVDRICSKAKEYDSYKQYNSDRPFRIITVSRLSAEKNVIKAVEIADMLRRNGLRFKWHIVGDGNCRETIDTEIDKLNLGSYVMMEGNRSNPYPYIKGADLMVHLSPIESFGLVILEAMALGVPCIAVESIGAKELIDGHNGILVQNDSAVIADTICRIITDKMVKSEYAEIIDYKLRLFSGQSISTIFNILFV